MGLCGFWYVYICWCGNGVMIRMGFLVFFSFRDCLGVWSWGFGV